MAVVRDEGQALSQNTPFAAPCRFEMGQRNVKISCECPFLWWCGANSAVWSCYLGIEHVVQQLLLLLEQRPGRGRAQRMVARSFFVSLPCLLAATGSHAPVSVRGCLLSLYNVRLMRLFALKSLFACRRSRLRTQPLRRISMSLVSPD
jgi:hypothetical protein